MARRESVRLSSTDAEAAANRGLRTEAPVHASGFRVERVDVAGIRRHIQPSVVHRLAVQCRGARKPERPFQLQARHLPGRSARRPRPVGTASSDSQRPSRSRPARPTRALADESGTYSASSRPRRPVRCRASGRPPTRRSDACPDRSTPAAAFRIEPVVIDLEDPLRRHLLEHGRPWRLMSRLVALVARGAVVEVLIDACAFRLRGDARCQRKHRYEYDDAPRVAAEFSS